MARKLTLPCQTKLRLLLDYDPISGDLRWKLSARRGWQPGRIAGSVRKRARGSYRVIVIEGVAYFAQRLIWKMQTGQEPEAHVDHADGNTLNNAWVNLRAASNVENGYNRKLHKNNKSGIKGVHWKSTHKVWSAVITVNKRVIRLGLFKSLDAAAKTVAEARERYHGEFARAA